MAMTTDLSINNTTHPKNPSKLAVGIIKYFESDGQPQINRTLEERRTYLGAFYITSMCVEYRTSYYFLADYGIECRCTEEASIL